MKTMTKTSTQAQAMAHGLAVASRMALTSRPSAPKAKASRTQPTVWALGPDGTMVQVQG